MDMREDRVRNAFGKGPRGDACGGSFLRSFARRTMWVRLAAGCALAGLLVPCAVQAQQASVSGFVTDVSDGQPLELVNVALEQGGNLVRGAATNEDGLYVIAGLAPGAYRIEARFVGYRPHVDSLQLRAGAVRTYNIAMEPADEEMDEVLVESEREGGAARVTAGQQTIRAADIEYVPGPDVTGDLATYLSAQPGVVTTGDRGGQLFIRGGEPSQNLVQLDGILLYQPFHIMGFYSAFPSDNINRVDIYAGGYGSEFGGWISSVIDISSRTGNMRRYAASAAASPFLSSARLEGPLWPGRISMAASVRRSNIEQGVARYLDDALPFTFGDAFFKLHTVVKSNMRASVTGLKTWDRGFLTGETGGIQEEIGWRNDAIGMRLLMLPRVFSIMANFHVSYSRLETELGPREDPLRWSRIENTHVSADATYFGDGIDARGGSELRATQLNSAIGGLYQNIELRYASVPQWGSYLDLDISPGGGFSIRPGMRLQFYRVRFEPFIEPRLRAAWQRGIHEISTAWGIYHQEILGLNDRRDAASVFTVWASVPKDNPNLLNVLQGRPQRATHFLLGYRAQPLRRLELSLEGYYRNLSNLFISEWTSYPRFISRLQPATGRSMGVDVRLELRGQRFYGYANYGLSSTRYEAEDASIPLWYGEETLKFRPPHDRRHQLNMVAVVEAKGFDLSVRWDFGSGLPFSRAIGFDGFLLVDDVEKAVDTPSTRRIIYEKPFNALLPTYHRLDVSVERTFSVGPVDVALLASAINTYGRRNIFYLDIFTLNRVDQLPFVPSLGMKVSFE